MSNRHRNMPQSWRSGLLSQVPSQPSQCVISGDFLFQEKILLWFYFIHLAVLGLSCIRQGLSLQHTDSPTMACGLSSCSAQVELLQSSRISIPRPGIKPTSLASQNEFLTTGIPGKSHMLPFKNWLIFVFARVACTVLDPPPGIESMVPLGEVWSPNHWTAKGFPMTLNICCFVLFLQGSPKVCISPSMSKIPLPFISPHLRSFSISSSLCHCHSLCCFSVFFQRLFIILSFAFILSWVPYLVCISEISLSFSAISFPSWFKYLFITSVLDSLAFELRKKIWLHSAARSLLGSQLPDRVSSLVRWSLKHWTCIRRWSLKHWTTREIPSF